MEAIKALIVTIIVHNLVINSLSFLFYGHIYKTGYNISNF